jgi:hypothetical protein
VQLFRTKILVVDVVARNVVATWSQPA